MEAVRHRASPSMLRQLRLAIGILAPTAVLPLAWSECRVDRSAPGECLRARRSVKAQRNLVDQPVMGAVSP